MINIHCIFNPDYVSCLENDFFNTFTHKSNPQNFQMNRQGIISLGKLVDNSILNEQQGYKKGIDNFVVSHSDLNEILVYHI